MKKSAEASVFGSVQSHSGSASDFQMAIEGDMASMTRLQEHGAGWTTVLQRFERVNGAWRLVEEGVQPMDLDASEATVAPHYDA